MVFIIGEIGTNHLGDLNIAKKIIQCAVNTGFDAVKIPEKKCRKNIHSRIFELST